VREPAEPTKNSWSWRSAVSNGNGQFFQKVVLILLTVAIGSAWAFVTTRADKTLHDSDVSRIEKLHDIDIQTLHRRINEVEDKRQGNQELLIRIDERVEQILKKLK
jgi:hypothetical protein